MFDLDHFVPPLLEKARIPGAAIALVGFEKTVITRAYGYRDLAAKLPMTPCTRYPIASTTKAITATLLGLCVDDGLVDWDAPVSDYLRGFRLADSALSSQITVRDLVAMRTGLPRHDFCWLENPISAADLVTRFSHLPLSSGLRERFQYNNLTPSVAAHVAEVVTGKDWKDLVRQRILEPLQMTDTTFAYPDEGFDITSSYHETVGRLLVESFRLNSNSIAPAGGAIYSTIEDMAKWVRFNLYGGMVDGQSLIRRETLETIHTACTVVGADKAGPRGASYALGWFVDHYRGRHRLSHGGYLHDVNSSVVLFPHEQRGAVSFVNFGPPRLARVLIEACMDAIEGGDICHAVDDALAAYEAQIVENEKRLKGMRRVPSTVPSHPLDDYVGTYSHAAYGVIAIEREGSSLVFVRGFLRLHLEHWHYDAWVIAENDMFEIHEPHMFDRCNHLLFETSAKGEVQSFTMPLEPALVPIRFYKAG